MTEATREALEALVHLVHPDPHTLLGYHEAKDKSGKKGMIFRAFHPDAARVELLLEGREPLAMDRVHDGGVFAAFVPAIKGPVRYRHRFTFGDGATWERDDPYRFLPTIGEQDLHFAGEGRHWRLYDKMGAHVREIDGVRGVSFAVWAPNARRVSVVGSFNRWDGRLYPMRRMGNGIWEIFIPGIDAGALYKFEIRTPDGRLRLKLDPFAFHTQVRPETAGIVWERAGYQWGDDAWLDLRPTRDWQHEAVSIYEVHLGSWMRNPEEGNRWLTYEEIAPRLISHMQRYGFTHVEFLPLSEHPLDASWGYQVTGYYAVTSRFGTPEQFKKLVDLLHQAGIGVIIDWVPAHFPKDDFALRRFDGTALYEHEDPRQGEHKDWGTLIFNYGRNEVANFLVSNALFWMDEYHVDGLRVDAVASMLYLDYSRKDGEWIPNRYGGRENLEAVDFLRRLNVETHSRFPGCLMIAEESTAWPGVSRPAHLGGLGFDMKWNMGWMNDTLRYFGKPPIFRSFHHNDITFSMIYQYSENFVLPFSHDEVVHGKGSLLAKMPGDLWQRFANLRTLYAYMFAHPGKKLLFQGAEYAQAREWNSESSLDWHEASHPLRKGMEAFFADLGQLYRQSPAMWRFDSDPRGFSWIDCSDWQASVLSLIRWGETPEDHIVFVFNLTPVPRTNYRVGVPLPAFYEEVLNSDSAHYGGSNLGNSGGVQADNWAMHGHYHSLGVLLPPLAAVAFRPKVAK